MTYSITGWCARTRHVGYAMASYDVNFAPPPAATSAVLPDLGSATCQASTRPGFGGKVLEGFQAGRGASDALENALRDEEGKDFFQVCVVDAQGRAAAYTGARTLPWHGDLIGKECAAAGNLLAGEAVVEALVAAFEREAARDLPDRLLTALEAGFAAGGDRRGTRGASLWIAGSDLPFGGLYLRAQEHAKPLEELRRLLDASRRENEFMGAALRAGAILMPLLDQDDLERRLGDATTLDAISQLRVELRDSAIPAEALELLAVVETYLRADEAGQGAVPFRDTMGALRIFLGAG